MEHGSWGGRSKKGLSLFALDEADVTQLEGAHAQELSHLRLEQIKLLRQENEILRAELHTMSEMLSDRNTRIRSLQKSLELFVELLVIWLQGLGESESQRIVTNLIDILLTQTSKSLDTNLVKEGLQRVSIQLSQRSGRRPPIEEAATTLAGAPPPRKRLPRNRQLSPPVTATSPPTSTQDPQRVPPLRLGAVGSGAWMSGNRTAGDTYM